MLCDLISHSGVLIPLDTHWETDGPFECSESDQQCYSLWEIRVFLHFFFINIKGLHGEIYAVCNIQHIYSSFWLLWIYLCQSWIWVFARLFIWMSTAVCVLFLAVINKTLFLYLTNIDALLHSRPAHGRNSIMWIVLCIFHTSQEACICIASRSCLTLNSDMVNCIVTDHLLSSHILPLLNGAF